MVFALHPLVKSRNGSSTHKHLKLPKTCTRILSIPVSVGEILISTFNPKLFVSPSCCWLYCGQFVLCTDCRIRFFLQVFFPLPRRFSGWWFGRFLFSHILGVIIPIDFHIFRRWPKHQPVLVSHHLRRVQNVHRVSRISSARVKPSIWPRAVGITTWSGGPGIFATIRRWVKTDGPPRYLGEQPSSR